MATKLDWDLPRRIIELSEADNWPQAVREWYLRDIEMLDPGESSECLCGHKPIRELCYIANRENSETAIVGNHCIEKFDKADPGHEVFGAAPRIIQAALRILKDSTASANETLIDFAEQRQIFTTANAEFYRDIWRKRNLTDGQEKYKQSLNQQLLYCLILSARGAYQRLKLMPREGTAGPKLIDYAFNKGVIKERDKEFYLQNWQRVHGSLTDKQRKYKEGLNQRIIRDLSAEFDR